MSSGENPNTWIDTTCHIILESNLRDFDGWLDFIFIQESDPFIEKAMNYGISAVCKKVNQNESQKAAFIICVLTVIKRYGPINVSQIIRRTRLSNNSVNRTLKTLLKKHIIKYTQKRHRKNNEKIFSVNKKLERRYVKNLLLWKGLPDAIRFEKQLKNDLKNDIIRIKNTPEGISDVIIQTYEGKKLPRISGIPIGELNRPVAKKIIMDYLEGEFCYNCFWEGHLRKWVYHNGESFCPKCFQPKPEDNLPIIRQKRFRRKV